MYRADSGFADRAKTTASNMASSLTKKTYPVPDIPQTPSNTINNMLQERCGKSFDNPVKAAIAQYICRVFTIINHVYKLIHKDSVPSHTMWMVSCGVIALAIIIKMTIIYQVLIASAFLVQFVLYYTAMAISLFGAGLGVAGMVFFDKDGGKSKSSADGFSSTVRTTYRNAQATVESTYSKAD
jgi:hypothetical protein